MCPGALRPWVADDGLLVRLRVVGGHLPTHALARLLEVSAQFSDGDIHLTRRANLQLRGFSGREGRLTPEAVSAIESTGLLPSRTHELVRNILVSPQSGLTPEHTDLRPTAHELDTLLCADPSLARLPGRFLFTMDDGRGDLMYRLTGRGKQGTDLGVVGLGGGDVQLRVGEQWGEVIPLESAARRLADLAVHFLAARGTAWHIRELASPLHPTADADPRLPSPAGALPYGGVPGGDHVEIPDGVLTPDHAARLLARARDHVVVTPWHGILIPNASEAHQ